MIMGHTKGKWEVSDELGTIRNAFTIRSGNTYICEMYALGEELNQANSLEAKHNAKLIASAPDLLSTLQDTLQWIDNELDWKYVPQIENVRGDIQQAINKAKGG